MKKQRFLSLFLAIMMIFSSFLPQTAIAFAETDDSGKATAISSSSSESTTSGAGTVVNPPDTTTGAGTTTNPEISTDTLHVRIEGSKDTLYDNDVELILKKDTTPKDVLIAAIGEDQIEATTSNGYFITGLLGESQKDNLGWSYGVITDSDHFIYPTVGADQYDALLNEEGTLQVKELIFYITYYDSATLYTKMPIVTVTNDEAQFTVTVKTHDAGTPAVENAIINISDGRVYKTNASGQSSFSLNQAKDYQLTIEQYLKDEATGQEYPYLIRYVCTVSSPGKNDSGVSTAVDEILALYKDKTSLSNTEALAYNHLQTNTADYITTFKKNTSNGHAALADNIIGCIATQQDASSYIKKLLDAQQDDGSFMVEDENTSATNLANVILALDMASATYDVDKAIEKLLTYKTDGHFEDVNTTALVLMALAPHSDIPDVKSIIDSSLDYLAEEQLNNGGYDGFGYGNSPYTTGPVIQALVRLKEDFTDVKWKKETRSIIEALIACKLGDAKGYDFVEGWKYGDATATAYAFTALSDYAMGSSAYDAFKLSNSTNEIELELKSVINDITIYLNSLETRKDSNWVEHPAFYRPLETLALNSSAKDINSVVDDLSEKFVLNNSEGTLPYAMNIIGLSSTGQNSAYYVNQLINNQLDNGSFKVGMVEQTEWATIALDIANASYNEEKAIAYILSENEHEESVALLATALIALSNHKDIDGVSTFINEKITYIQTQQLSSGGFETISGYGEDSVATALVVSALVANGINPLEESKWIKNDKTLLDVLLSYKKLNYFIYNETYGEYMYKDEATEQVFIAMIDLLNQQSSFSHIQPCKSLNALAVSAYNKAENYLLTSNIRTNDSSISEDMFYSCYEALALNASADDKKTLYSQLQRNIVLQDGNSVESLAENLIASIATGKILSLSNGKYQELLIAKQKVNGGFSDNIIIQAQSIIALDMANVIYDSNSAIEKLSQMINENTSKDVEEICWSLIALSRYQDESKYNEVVDGLLKNLSDKQNGNAGFGDAAKNGLALQALVAVNEKATSEAWKKGSNTIIENLIDSQLDDGTFKLHDSSSSNYATGMALLGLASQINGSSPYLEVTPELDPADIYKKHIKDIHDYYSKINQLNYIQATGLYLTNESKSNILSKLESRSDEAKRTYIVFDNDVEMLAKDIIGVVGIDENPYNFKGRNLVDTLASTMNNDGGFLEDDTANISSQAYAIIALDMANCDYDATKAVQKLIQMYNAKDKENKLSIYYISETMIALSNHTDMPNIPEMINTCKNDLKMMQMTSGGFDYSDGTSSNASEVSEYDAIAIQAIIAIGENPISDEYSINGKNPVDGLLSFKRDKHFIYDESKLSYQVYHESSSGYALAALVDLDKQSSIYHKRYKKALSISKEQLKTHLDQATSLILQRFDDPNYNYSSPWMVLALNGGDQAIPASFLERIKAGDMPASNSGQYGKYILGILAAGGDPTNINDQNLLDELCKLDDMVHVTEKGGMWTTPYGLLALDAINYEIPADAGFTRDDITNKLLTFVDPEGDIDSVAFVITALSKYYDTNTTVKDAIDQVFTEWSKVQTENGGFISKWSGENINTTAQALMALSFTGQDPQSDAYTKNGNNIIDYMLSLQNDDGTFNTSATSEGSIKIATEQTTYALAQYYRQLEGRQSIFDFNKIEVIKALKILISKADENGVGLKLEAPSTFEIKKYNIYRNNFDKVYASTNDKNYIDTHVKVGETYKYKVDGLDESNNVLITSTVYSVMPEANQNNNAGDNDPQGTPVYIRVVGYEGEILPQQLIYVKNYDMTSYLGAADGSSATPSTGWNTDKFNGPTVAHAIVTALERNHISYDYQDYGDGLYMAMIDGEREHDHGGYSGWNYDINGNYPMVMSNKRTVSDYDVITWYYAINGFECKFPSLKLSRSSMTRDEHVEVTLKDIRTRKAIENAVITINGDASGYRTNSEGKATLFFDEDGTYSISATHKENGQYDMVVPVSAVLQVGKTSSGGSSGGGSGSSNTPAKAPIVTQYTAAYAELRKTTTTEKSVIENLDNVRDKVYGRMLKANTAEKAVQLSRDAQDAAELIKWSLDKIETPEAAKDTFLLTNDLMTSVAKSTDVLAKTTKDADAIQNALKATKANADNALSTLNIVAANNSNQETVTQLLNDFTSEIVKVKNNISTVEQQKLDALMTASAQEFLNTHNKITVETRDDGYMALFNGDSLVELGEINKRTTNLANTLLSNTNTTPIKTVLPKVVLNVDTKQSDQVTAYIDKQSLDRSDLSKDATVIVNTPIGALEIPKEVRIVTSGNQIKVSLVRINREEQSDNLKSFIKNDSQVIDVKLSVNRVEKHLLDQAIEVSIPYESGKNTEHQLVVYHENEDGTFEKFASVYNPDTKMVTFKTRHLSQFFVKAEKKKFDDVTNDLWSKTSIERLSSLGVITGKDDYNFMPEEKVTRAEFATMLNRLMALIPEESSETRSKLVFKDVDSNQWYSDNVNAVVSHGWMNGKSDERFDPNGYITQQEIACVMANILSKEDYMLRDACDSESDIASWAQPSVTLIDQLGMIDALTARGFIATEKTQRDEVAVLLDELSKILIQ